MNRLLFKYFPLYFTDGAIFSKMSEAPWQVVKSGLEMDIAYLGSYSGLKPSAYIINQFISGTTLDEQKLADMLWKLFGHNWQRLWDAYMSEYDPLDNYNIEEVIERQTDTDRTIDRDVSENGTVDYTDELGTTTTDSGTSSVTSDGTTTVEFGKKNTTDSTGKSSTDYGRTVTTDSTTDSTTTYGKTTDNTTNDVTKVDYGKIVDATAESDMFTHGFNTVDKVPTGVTISTSNEKSSGTDTTTSNGTSNTVEGGSDITTTTTNSKTADGGTDTTNTSGTVNSTDSGSDKTINHSDTETTVNNKTVFDSDDKSTTTSSTSTTDDTKDTTAQKEEIIRTRKGNIGQNTYQELLRQEFELWKWNFYRQVFDDCDSILCLRVFGSNCCDYGPVN